MKEQTKIKSERTKEIPLGSTALHTFQQYKQKKKPIRTTAN